MPFTPGAPSNPPELADYPETLAGPLPVPLADPRTRAFVEQWRNASYNCFSSGHKFCREVCPVTQVERNESWTPTAFHANVVAMERGELDIADIAADYVNCTQCGACELRCPNTLFTGDFYRFRTRTVDVVKAVRALAVESGVHQPNWQVWNERTDLRTHEPVLGETPVSQEQVRDWAEGLDLPIGGETVLFVDCEAAFYRTSVPRAVAQMLQLAGYEFGLMGEQWCCGGPAAEMGYVEQAQRFARHNLDNWRATGTKRRAGARPARLHQLHRGLPEVLRRGVRHRGRARHRGAGPAAARGPADAVGAGGPGDHVPRPVPAQQAQGHLAGAARAAARDPRAALRGRRPGDPVVLLLRRRRRPADREARAHREDQRPAPGAGRGARRRHPGQRLPVVGAAAGEAGDAQDIDVVDLHELFAQSLGITVGGSRGDVGDRRLAQERTGVPGRARRTAAGGGAAAAAAAAAAATVGGCGCGGH